MKYSRQQSVPFIYIIYVLDKYYYYHGDSVLRLIYIDYSDVMCIFCVV